ncbi:XRE family transcriptional regulator [Pueribacillus theae]|uniref:XRE family transcriptional regulator n=1 Tax=Pueribacillus theae TaxID=2171751 RepID=A0A2U1JW57_9BACI|nr:XRE family transcriptional regulator [Pueribacillus theae]PWA09225.1 XRE family transcriptional regulator [Pueribacillus theae]
MGSKELGKRIKLMRTKKKLTQASLAELVGITKSHISKIENGVATPSLVTLSKIAEALGSPMSWFVIQEEHEGLSIVRKSDRNENVAKNEIGYEYELLANKNFMSNINPTIVTVLKGAEEIEPYVHDNDEFIYVITGAIQLKYDGKTFNLVQGDSAYFSGKKPHIFINNSDEVSKVLTIYVEE